MSNEIERWEQAGLEAVVKEDGPMRPQIDQLHNLFEANQRILKRVKSDGQAYEVIPDFPITGYYGERWHTRMIGMANLIRQPGRGLRDIHCLVERTDGSKQRLIFDNDAGIVLDADSVGEEVIDSQLVGSVLTGANRAVAERRQEVKAHRRRRNAVAAVLAGVVSVSSLTVSGFELHEHGIHARARYAQALRNAFDAAHHDLPGPAEPLPEPRTNHISAAAYNAIPAYKDGDDLRKARRIKIGSARSCFVTDAPFDESDKAAVTDIYGYNDDMVALRTTGGSFALCRLDNAGSWWEAVVQINDSDSHTAQAPAAPLAEQPASGAHISSIPLDYYKSIPTYKTGDTLRSPRVVRIKNAQSCTETDAPLKAGDEVKVSDVYGYADDDIVAVRNNGDTVTVCRLDHDIAASWDVAVQVVPGS